MPNARQYWNPLVIKCFVLQMRKSIIAFIVFVTRLIAKSMRVSTQQISKNKKAKSPCLPRRRGRWHAPTRFAVRRPRSMRVTDEVENQPQPTGQPRKVSFPSAQSRAERDATTNPPNQTNNRPRFVSGCLSIKFVLTSPLQASPSAGSNTRCRRSCSCC